MQRAESILPALRGWLESDGAAPATASAGTNGGAEVRSTIEVQGDLDAVNDWFETHNAGDGLPIVPPTAERVRAMLGRRDPRTSFGPLAPRYAEATLEKMAANAVMAGCRPEHFPVVLAAIRAMLQPGFNLYSVQVTTHPCAPLLVVHGPIAQELGINGGIGTFGPGVRANAAIGRAVRLILSNVGGAFPGIGDWATQGNPAKFSFCITENVADSPWPELHTTRGFSPEENAVTVIATEAPHNVKDNDSADPERFLKLTCDVMKEAGHNTWYLAFEGHSDLAVIFCPDHVALLARHGWDRGRVRDYLFRNAVRSAHDLRSFGAMWNQRDWTPEMNALAERDPQAPFPIVRSPDGILIMVAGGPGQQSSFLPGFGVSRAVTQRIE